MPEWGSVLSNLYWHLRYIRPFDQAARRRHYRKIAHEKKRLIETGVDPEQVRLFCRWLANPKNNAASIRFQNFSRQLSLF